MRWDNLFDDLEGQLEHELNAEDIDLRAEEERLRLGRLSLRTRLAGLTRASAHGAPALLRVLLVSGETITLRASTFGRDWLAADLLDSGARGVQCVIPLAAIAGVELTAAEIAESLGSESESSARLIDRIGLSFVFRDLCRRRTPVQVQTSTGVVAGTIDRVGRDHLDIAVHPLGTLRRASAVTAYRIVPFAHITLVRLG